MRGCQEFDTNRYQVTVKAKYYLFANVAALFFLLMVFNLKEVQFASATEIF
jgi:hypothetical protein